MPDRLMWVDIETTGYTQNAPLEIAIFTTDFNGQDVQHKYQSLVLPAEFFDGSLEIDPDTWHVHYGSGLIMEFEGLQELNVSLEEKLAVLNKYAVSVIDFTMAKGLHGQEYMLAGDSVWYDRDVLLEAFPKTFATIDTHTLMDTGSFEQALLALGYSVPEHTNRAMADLERSLLIYRMAIAGLTNSPEAIIDAGE